VVKINYDACFYPQGERSMQTSLMLSKFIIAFLLIGIVEPLYACKASNASYLLQTHETIQEAIDAARPGDTVYISSGVYFENLVINKSITIVGEGWSNTVLSGNKSGTIVEILSDNVSLCGFTLCNAEEAIALDNVKNCEIRENFITNISLSYGTGIHAVNCENITVEGNYFEDIYYYHVFFQQTRNSRIKRNSFTANMRWSQPIFVYFSDQNVIELNLVSGCGVVNEGGIGLLYSNNNIILYNNIVENDWVGISLRFSNCCVIEGNTIFGQDWFGLRMEGCKDNRICCNNFVSNHIHAYLKSCENMTWNTENYGNYWDNYNGKDENHDGIGDEPYGIDMENHDTCPLMGRFHYYEIVNAVGEKTEIFLVSNSTVEALRLISVDDRVFLNINVSDSQGNFGFCLVKFSKDIIKPPYAVEIDGDPPMVLRDISNDEFAILYFSYLHKNGQESILIVPEFVNILAFVVFLIFSILLFVVLKQRRLPYRLHKKEGKCYVPGSIYGSGSHPKFEAAIHMSSIPM
jgi:parallel beta-helix repeat protein